MVMPSNSESMIIYHINYMIHLVIVVFSTGMQSPLWKKERHHILEPYQKMLVSMASINYQMLENIIVNTPSLNLSTTLTVSQLYYVNLETFLKLEVQKYSFQIGEER